MKNFTTRKSIRERSDYVLQIGYCDLQNLLDGKQAEYYNSGVYGWNCDYYFTTCGSKCGYICTGRDPHGYKVNYALVREYDKKAEEICKRCIDFPEKRETLDKLLNEFLVKALA